VGIIVGSDVVGESVGDMVGDMVGDSVGDIVGDSVGDIVGDSVGDIVGDSVGDIVGLEVGSEEQTPHLALQVSATLVLAQNPSEMVLQSNSTSPLPVGMIKVISESLHSSVSHVLHESIQWVSTPEMPQR